MYSPVQRHIQRRKENFIKQAKKLIAQTTVGEREVLLPIHP